jgi:hypothetical protein
LADGSTIAELANQVHALNRNLQEVVLERIEMDSTEVCLGGAELT